MGFSRQECWSGLLCPPTGYLLGPGIESASLTSNLPWQVGSLPLVLHGKPPNPFISSIIYFNTNRSKCECLFPLLSPCFYRKCDIVLLCTILGSESFLSTTSGLLCL
ncbi:unnamed protein product [Rangifer tarandus platyrhynchus]|uniref:Uncharacterized protein n=2 Tax=Rangifer tarandus platyrhynchus TaxID=3082113 RepID=A0AC59Z4W5_RANTA|nr:unnamed protein product [Rangifer tarandus platyrhynchus]